MNLCDGSRDGPELMAVACLTYAEEILTCMARGIRKISRLRVVVQLKFLSRSNSCMIYGGKNSCLVCNIELYHSKICY